MKYAFAGDRNISCEILSFIIEQGYRPLALFVTDDSRSSHKKKLMEVANLDKRFVFTGNSFKEKASREILESLELDYIFGIHFPYIIPKSILEIPEIGFLNLHPAFLPYNKGWHTPSWAIMDKTPYGATLHFMTEALDDGDIVHQKELQVSADDTANTLYQKVLKLEKEVFFESFEEIVTKQPRRIPQKGIGSSHNRRDLQAMQEIDLEESVKPMDLLNHLRALTTNKKAEAAFIIVNGQKIGINVHLFKMDEQL